MKVYDSNGNPVWLGENVGHGGEAAVYLVLGRPHLLAKIYTPAPRPNYDRKLAWMVDHPPLNPTRAQEHPSLAWPVGMLYYPNRRLAGYVMPYIQVAVPVLEVYNPKRRAEIFPQFDRRYLHRVARNLAAALNSLHREGYVAGDLNESNTMVTPRAMVTLIDTDSFQVEENRNGKITLHPCPVGKYEYTPPELQGQPMGKIYRKPEHDAFGLGVLVFQLLMDGSHPFRSQWLGEGEPPPIEKKIAMGAFPYMISPTSPTLPPKNALPLNYLHPAIVELVRRCFVDGHRSPAIRPNPSAWEKAIAEAEEALIACPQGHLYSGHLRSCPYCRAAKNTASASSSSAPEREEIPEPSLPSRTPYRSLRTSNPARAIAAPPGSLSSLAFPKTSIRRPNLPIPSWRKITAPFVSRSHRSPALRQVGLRRWAQPRIYKSFAVGGTLGALSGAILGSLAGVASWTVGEAAAWSLLWALGGATAGGLRGWQPGFRLSHWIDRNIGWHRFWQFAGITAGAFTGGLIGLVFGWTFLPVCIALSTGAALGWLAGNRIWLAGNRLNWERIWGLFGACLAAILGWKIAAWTSASGLGLLADRFASSLAAWVIGGTASWALAWLVLGAVGGALGGAVAGVFIDLFARLSGLVD